MRIVVTGAAGVLGRRVVAQLSQTSPQAEIIAIDRADMSLMPVSVATEQVDLEAGNLPILFSGADAVVHLASAIKADSADISEAERESAMFLRLLDALSSAGVAHFMMMSSAMVYGAQTDNPVPLTEDAPIRPNADFGWAVQRHRMEQLARRWATDYTSTTLKRSVAILRPAAVVAEGRLGHLARVLRSARTGVTADGDPPVQYLHVDDLATAVVTVLLARYDGAVNVAPDGWIPPDGLADLEGHRPRLRVSARIAKAMSTLFWRSGLTPTPPGVVSYTSCPWVVANDKLRGLGWTPTYSNEEAWVVSHEPLPWESLTTGRRQQLLLAAATTALLGMIALVAIASRHLRCNAMLTRKRQRSPRC